MSLGGSQPTPPSPQAVGQSAQQVGAAAQAGSQYNQYNPTGSLSYTQTGTGPGGVPIYSATSAYSPIEQALFNQYTGTQQAAGAQAANALGFGNYGTISPQQQIGNETSGITGDLMNQWLSSQEPFYQTQTQQLDTQLKNEGLQPGNPAYDNAMRQLTTNQGYAVAGAASQFEPQAFSQASTLYGLPMNVSSQLAQWGAPASPISPQTPPNQAVQALGAETTAAQNQYQAQQAQYNAQQQAIGGLFGMGGNLLGTGLSNLPGGAFAGTALDFVGA